MTSPTDTDRLREAIVAALTHIDARPPEYLTAREVLRAALAPVPSPTDEAAAAEDRR